MKLLLISQYFPPEVGAGATRSEAMVRYLGELGWEIEVISELPNYPTGIVPPSYKKRKFHQQEIIHNAIIHRVWVWANARKNNLEKMGLFVTYLWSSLTYVVLYPKKYDLVYASSPPIFAAIAGCLIAKLLQTRFVLEIRDIWPDAAVDIGSVDRHSFLFKFSKIVELWLYRNADLIIPVTEASRDIIEQRAPGKQVHVISNGVDLDIFKPIPNAKEMLDEPVDTTKFRVGYVGSLGVIHDMRTLVKAAKLCEDDPDIEFIVIGDGGQRQEFLDAIEQVKPANLKWLGLKQHEQIPIYISSFDLALNPVYGYNIFESIITVKFYEYLACGVPVISTSRGLLKKESEKSGAAIAVEPENAEILAKKIKRLKTDPHLLEEMKLKAHDYIRLYSRKVLANKLSETLINTI